MNLTLNEKVAKTKESEIYKLVFENSVLGLRVKCFNVNTDKFEYYDFSLDIIKNKELMDFLNGIKGMKSIALIRKDGLLLSGAELNNNLVIQEFEDTGVAEQVLNKVRIVYDYNSNTSFEYRALSHKEDPDDSRVYYTIEVANGKFVDILCILGVDGSITPYTVDTGDGCNVYDSDQNSFAGYSFDESTCFKLALESYKRDYRR